MCRTFVFLALLAVARVLAQSPTGYYRYPAIHDDTVVFTSEGDLWRVSASGGVAQRLTTHPGVEAHAAISPDGGTVAFSAGYEGPTEVYTMPLTGGLPTRLTFDGARATVVGWTPAGEVVYATSKYSTLPNNQLVSVKPGSGARRVLPLAQATEATFAPAGDVMFFTRFPHQSSSTKRYQGGWTENLWRFTPTDAEAVALAPEFKGTSKNPMWWEGRVYFVSDRDGVMNLWSMKPDGSDPKAHTKHRDYDVKSASLNAGRIVYQLAADLHLFDLARGSDQLIPITLASDFDQQREKWVRKPMEFVTSAHISATGDHLVLTARGQVFVAPVDTGRLVEVPRKPGVRFRQARFLPDGKSLLALSDETRELEFWKLPANGLGAAEQLTTNSTVFRFAGVPSPDGKAIAWGDKDQKLWIFSPESKETRLVAGPGEDEFTDFAWSPDSQWLAFTEVATNQFRHLALFRLSDGSKTVITSDRVDSFNPAWSADGKWLYFLSDREFRSLVPSPWGARQPDPYFTETTKLFQLALAKGQRSPFAPKDELHDAEDEKKPDSKKEDKPETPPKPATEPGAEAKPAETNRTASVTVKIELDGLAARLEELPVPAGNYYSLAAAPKHLLWGSRATGFGTKPQLQQLEITNKEPKPKTLVEDFASFELSGNGKKVLVRKGEAFHVIASDSAAPAKLEDRVNLDDWTFPLQPREEWRQIYTEAWRMLRDYFYDRNLHQVDWPAIHRKYQPLVDRVSDRSELSDVIYEMVGELSTLHIFVRFGDEREGPDQIKPAFLGANLLRDEPAGGWRIDHIYRADPDFPEGLSPLARPDVALADGDVILRMNGRPTIDLTDPGILLRNKAGKQVLLEVKPRDAEQSRPVLVTPLTADQESDLRYDEWEYTRRQQVEQLGGGQLGYVHLRAMGAANIAEWARDFYPVFQRDGLIVDVRHNRGGNIDSWILGKLLRKAWFYWQPRVGSPTWNMQYAFRGHVVVLCNEHTASDGEAFSEGFRRLGLGKVIGTRTWGGEIWLSADRWLVDRGMASAAETGVYGPEGTWLIEGHGVEPDIVVDNLPRATFDGRDAQLEAAVKHLQDLIAKEPRPVPPAPKYPDKRFPK